jgi:hypothetical protein
MAPCRALCNGCLFSALRTQEEQMAGSPCTHAPEPGDGRQVRGAVETQFPHSARSAEPV